MRSHVDQAPRYEAEQAVSGLWQVTDRQTGRPAMVDGYMQLGMEQEARDLANDLVLKPGRSQIR